MSLVAAGPFAFFSVTLVCSRVQRFTVVFGPLKKWTDLEVVALVQMDHFGSLDKVRVLQQYRRELAQPGRCLVGEQFSVGKHARSRALIVHLAAFEVSEQLLDGLSERVVGHPLG